MEILISNDPSLPCLLCLSIERRAYLAPGGGFSLSEMIISSLSLSSRVVSGGATTRYSTKSPQFGRANSRHSHSSSTVQHLSHHPSLAQPSPPLSLLPVPLTDRAKTLTDLDSFTLCHHLDDHSIVSLCHGEVAMR
jgi:hypothetical protein